MNDAVRIRRACLLDTETTGTDPAQGAKTIEIAVMLYDVEHASPISSFASLIHIDGNDEWGMPANPAEHINGIKPVMLKDARPADEVWRAVKWMIASSDVIVAHRAEFDRQFVPDLGKPWCCSKTDIKWPNRMRGDHLVQLALGLGLGVASAHRAMADVDTLARIFTRCAEIFDKTGMHSLEAMLLHAMRPKVKYISLAPFEEREVVKSHGFLWNPQAKEWYRFMPPEDIGELPFKVRT